MRGVHILGSVYRRVSLKKCTSCGFHEDTIFLDAKLSDVFCLVIQDEVCRKMLSNSQI